MKIRFLDHVAIPVSDLKIIRGGTSCYTLAFCSFAGHEDANLSIRDTGPEKFEKLTEFLIKMRKNSKGF